MLYPRVDYRLGVCLSLSVCMCVSVFVWRDVCMRLLTPTHSRTRLSLEDARSTREELHRCGRARACSLFRQMVLFEGSFNTLTKSQT